MSEHLVHREPKGWGRNSMGLISSIQDSVAQRILLWASRDEETTAIINEHQLHGVTPDMVNWWWDHIDSTQRYKLWHPRDHLFFTWLIKPEAAHVGAISRCTEKIGGVPITLDIRWEDPGNVKTAFQNILVASLLSKKGDVMLRFWHEYEAASYGTRMRSTFLVPRRLPGFVKRGLKKHNLKEMANFSIFLPRLYRENS